jgi:dihydrofolate synthase / folylpolyglutamate synthase
MSTGTAGGPLSPTGTPSSSAALDRVRRYLYEELGPGQGPQPADGTGPARSRTLFAMLGNPHDAIRTVHVAGTAGKGSVVAFIAGLFRARGFRVWAHTSPHVYSFGWPSV